MWHHPADQDLRGRYALLSGMRDANDEAGGAVEADNFMLHSTYFIYPPRRNQIQRYSDKPRTLSNPHRGKTFAEVGETTQKKRE